ncbi:hypothetical protein OIE66_41730 [Nonomuraea sp. NBC_01738]|uniref:hypothetical protein n=1 Tax=Nonomuraea sp. NBC_01738 TaxID=2976003 RepID=UPI002E117079|nr:hypothetical protein OIE66_41730 [Nonomuraea sp. NBC_01738]
MENLSRLKALIAIVGVSASLAALAPAPALADISAGCIVRYGKLTTSDGYLNFGAQVCPTFVKTWGTIKDTKSDSWTAVAEVDIYAGSKVVDGGAWEAGRKAGKKTYSVSSGRVDLTKLRIRARRCLPSTIVCNNTQTKTYTF